MAATVQIGGSRATIENGQWRSDDATLLSLLNSVQGLMPKQAGVLNPDARAAQHAVEQLGGEVESTDALAPTGLSHTTIY